MSQHVLFNVSARRRGHSLAKPGTNLNEEGGEAGGGRAVGTEQGV